MSKRKEWELSYRLVRASQHYGCKMGVSPEMMKGVRIALHSSRGLELWKPGRILRMYNQKKHYKANGMYWARWLFDDPINCKCTMVELKPLT